ncbi:hypothetical protein BH09VER1_BH09VER1_05820 [soil metagenome]
MDTVEMTAAWDDALARLLSFLNEYEIGGAEHRVRVALRIVDEARALEREGPPVQRVMGRAFAELDEWFGAALGQTDLPPALAAAAGAAALRLVPGDKRWSERLLSATPSDELKSMLSKVSLRTGPDLAISSMTSRDMDYGAMETLAHETWHQFAWLPLLRAVAIWTAIFFLTLYIYGQYFAK